MLRNGLLCNTHFYMNDFVPLFWAQIKRLNRPFCSPLKALLVERIGFWHAVNLPEQHLFSVPLYSRPENLSIRIIAILILLRLTENHNIFRFTMKSKKNVFSIISIQTECCKVCFSSMPGMYNKNYRWYRLVFKKDGPLKPHNRVQIFSFELY
jgi:hypothetical protein